MSKDESYSDLYFTREQLILSRSETVEVATDIFVRSPAEAAITDIDRAFIQRVLLIAVDTSEKAGLLFDLYSSAVKAMPSQSVQSLVKSFAKKVAKRWFTKYLKSEPKYSAVGKAALQYSGYATEWRMRTMMESSDELKSYILS